MVVFLSASLNQEVKGTLQENLSPKGFSGTSVNGGAPHQDAEESKYRDRALERRDLKNEYAPRQWEGGRES